jgi:hypothetical protein
VAHTIKHHFFVDEATRCTRSLKQVFEETATRYHTIVIDEASQVPREDFRVLYQLHMRCPQLVWIVSGFFRQMPSVETDGVEYDYNNRALIHALCGGNRLELTYENAKNPRYDRALYEVIKYVHQHHKLPNRPFPWHKDAKVNICNSPAYRNSHVPAMSMEAGTRIIGIANDKKLKVFNGQRHTIAGCMDQKVYLLNHDTYIPLGRMNRLFRSAHIETIQRTQGYTIDEKFNIFEVNKMTLNALLTSMQRAKRLADVGLQYTPRKFEWWQPNRNVVLVTPMKLQKGTIYELTWDGTSATYRGQTRNDVAERVEGHVENPVNARMRDTITKYGVPKATILEEFKEISDRELSNVERIWIKRAVRSGSVVLNVKHNGKAYTGELEHKIKVQDVDLSNEFKIGTDASKKRYRIRWTDVEGNAQHAHFPWSGGKAQAWQEAEHKRNELIKQRFGISPPNLWKKN